MTSVGQTQLGLTSWDIYRQTSVIKGEDQSWLLECAHHVSDWQGGSSRNEDGQVQNRLHQDKLKEDGQDQEWWKKDLGTRWYTQYSLRTGSRWAQMMQGSLQTFYWCRRSMIPAPGIMIWLVKSLIVDIFEMNIWQIFVKLYDSNGSLQ